MGINLGKLIIIVGYILSNFWQFVIYSSFYFVCEIEGLIIKSEMCFFL